MFDIKKRNTDRYMINEFKRKCNGPKFELVYVCEIMMHFILKNKKSCFNLQKMTRNNDQTKSNEQSQCAGPGF